jgi:hypothetical protein
MMSSVMGRNVIILHVNNTVVPVVPGTKFPPYEGQHLFRIGCSRFHRSVAEIKYIGRILW